MFQYDEVSLLFLWPSYVCVDESDISRRLFRGSVRSRGGANSHLEMQLAYQQY